jgi:hypothetical protein
VGHDPKTEYVARDEVEALGPDYVDSLRAAGITVEIVDTVEEAEARAAAAVLDGQAVRTDSGWIVQTAAPSDPEGDPGEESGGPAPSAPVSSEALLRELLEETRQVRSLMEQLVVLTNRSAQAQWAQYFPALRDPGGGWVTLPTGQQDWWDALQKQEKPDPDAS